jgi:divalent metal cation (Fe/Co/Zn/Cd) transporter
LKVQRVDGELSVSFHCALDAGMSIAEAHAFTERLEKDLRSRVPNTGRVVIHVEPREGEATP